MDQESQERGVVSIVFRIKDISFHQAPASYVEANSKMFRLASDMPFRYDAHHTCLEGDGPKEEHELVDRDVSIIEKEYMALFKAKYGTYDEWMQHLMVHGIPHDAIPFTKQNKIKTKAMMEMVEMMKTAEGLAKELGVTLAETPATIVPTRRDVLFGKGNVGRTFRSAN